MPKQNPLYKRVGIVYNPEKERAQVEFQRLTRWFHQRQIGTNGGTRVTAAMRNANLIVALGGDGTVLATARAVAAWGVPVLGVNVGRLGFLAATEVGAMFRTLSRVLAGQGRVQNHTMLSVRWGARGKPGRAMLALNDCVIRSGATGRVVELEAMIRDRLLASYVGDGLIVATPTGSTAYNLAASGPIVAPELDVMLLSPICPHSLSQRPLVMPSYEILTIEVGRGSPAAFLSLDGQVNQPLKPGDRVEVRRANEQIQLLMDPDRSYYQVLKAKLKWGGP